MGEHNLSSGGQEYVDIGDKPYDNKPNNVDKNDEHVIRLDEQQPLNDPNCEHSFRKDDDDLNDDFQAWVCSKCHRGTFLPKSVEII